MQTNNNHWRTVVLTVLAIVLGIFAWRFLTGASSDLQALFVGVGIGTLAGIPIGLLLYPRTARDPIREDAYEHGYQVGGTDGFDNGYNYAVQQYGRRFEHAVPLAQIPQEARELATVRR